MAQGNWRFSDEARDLPNGWRRPAGRGREVDPSGRKGGTSSLEKITGSPGGHPTTA